MKKNTAAIIFIICFTQLFLNAQDVTWEYGGEKVSSISLEEMQIVPYKEMSKEMMKEFSDGTLPYTVLAFQKGMQIPFSIMLSGNLLNIDCDDHPIMIDIVETFYMRFDESRTILFSDNLHVWKTLPQFLKMTISPFQFCPQEGIPKIQLKLEINRN